MSRDTITAGALLLLIGVTVWYMTRPATEPAAEDPLIVLETPSPNSVVRSPLMISGKARGNWYFEASFPVKLYDANRKLLTQVPAQAQSEWMTTDYVPFAATLTFDTPTTPTGVLVLEKDNPSGLPEHADQLEVPIVFTTTPPTVTPITLYFYNPALDQGPGGAQCSKNGLVAVGRALPKTITPLSDAIRLLLRGDLSPSERAKGITTEFPLEGVSLKNATIVNGVATLTFNDPENRTGGGSCRTAVLWAQIEATAKQFPSITTVRFLPKDLFQP
ncbi:MAG: Gmad2 immunoglobulin-like domain-containing protein [bacterium]|nr:Gmad2 immunoglobulin-like domain-containing protein [bacterium]